MVILVIEIQGIRYCEINVTKAGKKSGKFCSN